MSGRHARIFTGLILGGAMVAAGPVAMATSASAASVQLYRVATIQSGDTITVSSGGKAFKVRIAGVDAPEVGSKETTKKGCYATSSKMFLTSVLRGKQVQLVKDSKLPDKYSDGSLIRYVYYNGQDIGFKLVRWGYAKEYMYAHKNYDRRTTYKAWAAWAKSNGYGLWNPNVCPMNK